MPFAPAVDKPMCVSLESHARTSNDGGEVLQVVPECGEAVVDAI